MSAERPHRCSSRLSDRVLEARITISKRGSSLSLRDEPLPGFNVPVPSSRSPLTVLPFAVEHVAGDQDPREAGEAEAYAVTFDEAGSLVRKIDEAGDEAGQIAQLR